MPRPVPDDLFASLEHTLEQVQATLHELRSDYTDQLLTADEAAEYLNTSPGTLRQLVRDGRIKAIDLHEVVRDRKAAKPRLQFRRMELLRFAESLERYHGNGEGK